ncbi:MAG: nickel pincer cofactor biosynthesis protein LarC [Tannerella sp.]|jgi:uncharacterized protein (TIGR00299 family) protein|nr:nickel pincer cofactor biosynthesis protein LarC [Tannerella sp.]
MKILYFDCFAGISGDMTLSALLDVGVEAERLVSELKKLHLDGWTLHVSEVSKHGIRAKHVDVQTEDTARKHTHRGLHLFHTHAHHHPHEHRTMREITQIIDESALSVGVGERAKRIFRRLAVAEARIHGTTPDEVHFHEVGAVDSIIDIVGTAICIDLLAPDKICASVLHDGRGFTKCQHGTIPVPVPAVTEVLTVRGADFRQLDVEGELMTPTGAAIIAELAESFGPAPQMTVTKTGYGAGTRDLPVPNLLRVLWGESTGEATPDAAGTETVTVIETNIDDTTPEILGYVMERLLAAGARDVFFSPVYMKKCRPATQLSVLCDEAQTPAMEQILFTETSTIGLRKYPVSRTCLPRETVLVATPYGMVKAKKTFYGGVSRLSVEYEDARRLAEEKGVPLKDIYSAGQREK